MKVEKLYYVYIITNKYNTAIYIGMTNDLARRLDEHKKKIRKSHTQRYNLYKLIITFLLDQTSRNSNVPQEKISIIAIICAELPTDR